MACEDTILEALSFYAKGRRSILNESSAHTL